MGCGGSSLGCGLWGVWASSWGLPRLPLGRNGGSSWQSLQKTLKLLCLCLLIYYFFLLLLLLLTTSKPCCPSLGQAVPDSCKSWNILAGHQWVNQRCISWQMLPGMSRKVWRWESGGESGGFASKSPALPLPVEALFRHDVTDCVLCQWVQETFVVTRLGKKKGVRGILEIIALVENSRRVVCVGFGFVLLFFVLLCFFLICPSPLSLPPAQKKFFSSFLCLGFFPITKSVWKTMLVPRGPF